MHLALTGIFRAKWSNDVHEEWISNLLKNRPDLTRQKLERTRQLIDMATLDALVEDYENLIPSLSLPDENDRHVLAAAMKSEAQVIVTMNLKDFPSEVLQQYEIAAQHPDDFVLQLIELAPDAVMAAAETHRQSLKNRLSPLANSWHRWRRKVYRSPWPLYGLCISEQLIPVCSSASRWRVIECGPVGGPVPI
jgi:predicted nucleic acid-binding protein